MRVIKCDLCRRAVKKDAVIEAGVGWKTAEVCQKCGQPIINFLRDNKLLDETLLKQFTLAQKKV